jgi:Rrf2 family nitric oxide-sensitive transcriptional repressor
MKLTTKTDYCLRVLIYLQESGEKAKVKEIAEAYGISKNHLSVAVNKLSELGYITSTSGPKGGIEFNPDFADKTLKDLISKTEEFHIVECFDAEKNTCTLSPTCKLKNAITSATYSFLAELDKVMIKDLVD